MTLYTAIVKYKALAPSVLCNVRHYAVVAGSHTEAYQLVLNILMGGNHDIMNIRTIEVPERFVPIYDEDIQTH